MHQQTHWDTNLNVVSNVAGDFASDVASDFASDGVGNGAGGIAIADSPEPKLRLSQGQLNLLETCPRKFQHIYLEQLGSPSTPEQQAHQAWGSRFHLLMQQQELGLPIDALMAEDAQMQRCINTLLAAVPEIVGPAATSSGSAWRQSEHRRTCSVQGYSITVIYDLVMLEEQQARILDWKTYPRPPQRSWLAHNWQTRLYPFVLTETSPYLPEQISLTYWFVQAQDDPTKAPLPQSLTFPYSSTWHEQTRQELTQLLQQLTHWLERYQQGEPFPQVNVALDHCDDCQFSGRCQRHSSDPEVAPVADWLADLDRIDEVML
uniref:PD-(D/E)XK nuclease family protein n=1 Tax=Trichocoleus desertorum TaxID=1481672 RepID=UPI0025B572A8|nr:PD-(D/E)XK nuclease family protein [Trichocoleus desertorum]